MSAMLTDSLRNGIWFRLQNNDDPETPCMSDTFRFLILMALLLALLSFAGSLLAQYTQSETTAAYVQRSGASIAGQEYLINEADDSALLVQLPFAFQYFDRSYRSCWMSINGRVSFDARNAANASPPTSLIPPMNQNHRTQIFVLGTDLYARDGAVNQTLGAFPESGRVVLQWRDMALYDGLRCLHLNFQLHLHANGDIQMHYGAENSIAGYSHTTPYVSGATNHDGAQAVFGFGNSSTLQNTRPASGALVTLAQGFSPTDTVTINQNPMPARAFVTPPASNVPVLAFKLVACGNGATVTELDFTNPDFAADGNTVTLSLAQDFGTIGQYEGEAVIGTATTTGGSTSVINLSELMMVGVQRDYLLLASFATLNRISWEGYLCYDGSVSTSTISGSASSDRMALAPLGMAWAAISPSDTTRPVATPSATPQRLLTFTVKQDEDSPAFSIPQMRFDVHLTGGLTNGDLSRLQLWRDTGTLGEWDAADTLVSTLTVVASNNSFSGLAEPTSLIGTEYLLTVQISAGFASAGTVTAEWVDPPAGAPGYAVAALGPTVPVAGTASTLVIRDRPSTDLSQFSAAVSETGVHACTFELEAGSGAGTVSDLQFTEATFNPQITDARLYLDNGSIAGRHDAGDTLVTSSVSLLTTGLVLSLNTPLSITGTSTRLILLVDIVSNANSDMRFDLVSSGVTSTFAFCIGGATGTLLKNRAGSANGVDISAQILNTNLVVYIDNIVPIATITLQARGTGGLAPRLMFSAVDTICGRGINSRVHFELWLEGSGPLGVLDASDLECYGCSAMWWGTVAIQVGNTPIVGAGITRNFLLVVRHISTPLWDVTGAFNIAFTGFSDGTDVAWLPGSSPFNMPAITIDYQGVAAPLKNKSSDKDDGGGCTTSEKRGGLLFVGLVGVMGCLVLLWRALRQMIDGTGRA